MPSVHQLRRLHALAGSHALAVDCARGVDAAAHVVDGLHDETMRIFEMTHQVAIDDGGQLFLCGPNRPPRYNVVLQAFQFHDPIAGDIFDAKRTVIGKP